MDSLRRAISRLLARWAVRIDPDPPLKFTTRVGEGFSEATLRSVRRIDTPGRFYPDHRDAIDVAD
jgi:hypothetical protein